MTLGFNVKRCIDVAPHARWFQKINSRSLVAKPGCKSKSKIALRQSLPQQSIEVYSMGRQWYTSLHTFINYSVNLRQYKPQLIVVMQSINDLLHNADFGY